MIKEAKKRRGEKRGEHEGQMKIKISENKTRHKTEINI